MKNENKLRNQQKQEAIRRMKMLEIYEPTIREFEQEDKINVSIGGFMYWLTEEQQKMIDDFEKKNNALVYYVINTNTEFGELLSLLYVSAYKEEWEMDREDIKVGIAMSYVINLDCEWCSEFGSVSIRNKFGGLVRIY